MLFVCLGHEVVDGHVPKVCEGLDVVLCGKHGPPVPCCPVIRRCWKGGD